METEILIALIGRMIDGRIDGLPSNSGRRGARGFPGRDGQDGKDFSFAEHELTIREWAKEFALKFEDFTVDQIASLRGPRGTDGRDGKDFVMAEHEEMFRALSKEFALKFTDLTADQISTLRGPRGRDGKDGTSGHSFIFEENKNAIEGIIRAEITSLRESLRLRYADLTEDDRAELRGPRGRDGIDGRDFVFDEHREYFDSLKLRFSDLTDEEKESLKLRFSGLTELEKASLKLRFEDLTVDDRLSLRGPRGLRGQRGSHGRDGKDGLSIRGLPGPHGLRGLPGADGIEGRDGLNGADAPFVVDIKLEEYGNEIYFVFHYSDGSVIETDKVEMPKSVYVQVAGGGSSNGRKMDLETIVDEPDAATTYVGYARLGYAITSEPNWKIKRLTVSGTETIIQWADSNADFSHIWDDRAILTYG